MLVGDAAPVRAARSGCCVPAPQLPRLDLASLLAPPTEGGCGRTADDLVCTCNTVTNGQLRAAIREHGCATVGEVSAATDAGTSCGSCLVTCRSVLDDELQAAGIERDRRSANTSPTRGRSCSTSCGSTASTRSGELANAFGTRRWLRGLQADGRLDPRHLLQRPRRCSSGRDVLQDTNDRFLANIQKDGTYSVVPRVPGGEITPGEAAGAGRGRTRLRPLHQDHRRPAHRPVGRAAGPAARHLAAAGRRRASSPATPTASRCAP